MVPRNPSNIAQLKHHLTNAGSRLTWVSINAKIDIVLLKHGKPNLSIDRFLFLDRRADRAQPQLRISDKKMLMMVVAPLRGKFISRPQLSKCLSKMGFLAGSGHHAVDALFLYRRPDPPAPPARAPTIAPAFLLPRPPPGLVRWAKPTEKAPRGGCRESSPSRRVFR